MNFASWQATVQNLLAITPGDTNGQALFAVIQADMINDAELRCYRDLQLLQTEQAGTTTLTANSRNGTLPTGMIVAEMPSGRTGTFDLLGNISGGQHRAVLVTDLPTTGTVVFFGTLIGHS